MDFDQSQERTEQATEKRRREAKEKGLALRSRDLSIALVMLVGASSLLIFGKSLIQNVMTSSRTLFTFTQEDLMNESILSNRMLDAVIYCFQALLPILIFLMIAAAISPFLLGSFNLHLKHVVPQFSRLNPAKGLKKIFSMNSLVEFLKNLFKFSLISIFTFLLLYWELPKQISNVNGLILPSIYSGFTQLGWNFLILCCSLIILVAIDIPYQIYRFLSQIKMTKQEIRDEYRETEGRPEVKSRIRRVQQALAKSRMMSAVPKADVVITNPQHFAVALSYDKVKSGAPRVVAKGADLVAFQIRKLAEENNVNIVPAPPLARAIFYTTKLNQEIPQGLYIAVAQVLAYVYQLKRGKKPTVQPEFSVPDDYKKYSQ